MFFFGLVDFGVTEGKWVGVVAGQIVFDIGGGVRVYGVKPYARIGGD